MEVTNMAASNANSIISTVEQWFKKLPNLPKNIQEFIVMVAPWAALIFGILGVIGGISALGLFSAYSPIVMGMTYYNSGVGMVSLLLGLASSVLLLMAFPGLNKKKMGGWNWLFWSEVVSVISAIVIFSVGGIVFSLVGLYLVFQIKSYYK